MSLTRTAKLVEVASRVDTATLLDELQNRHERGTGGDIVGFLDYMLDKYQAEPEVSNLSRTQKIQVFLENGGSNYDIVEAGANRTTGNLERFIDELVGA